MILGWFVLTPLVALLGRPWESDADAGDETPAADREDPLATLQRRYAEGEIGEAEIERRLEGLLESDAAAGPERGAVDPGSLERPSFEGDSTVGDRSRDLELERDRN